MNNPSQSIDCIKAHSLQKALEAKVVEAMLAQRDGDIERYSQLWEEANQMNKELVLLQ
ncbi:DUF6435 family protein [Nitrincola tapanii]|uniref:DUF6435 family protein n=1 Tax=Nitrincola tapanii TaxID=1708751 RepID=UPI00190F23E0|nr:DUF6435 family protein [Nitrincola tapanii]